MTQRDRCCRECGQLFSDSPTKCPHCGCRLRKAADRGRLSDVIPGVRRLPYSVRKAMMLLVVFCVVAYVMDLVGQLDKLHTFMNRRGLPSWARK
jgi:uncharacterized membrane protein YvbJ